MVLDMIKKEYNINRFKDSKRSLRVLGSSTDNSYVLHGSHQETLFETPQYYSRQRFRIHVK